MAEMVTEPTAMCRTAAIAQTTSSGATVLAEKKPPQDVAEARGRDGCGERAADAGEDQDLAALLEAARRWPSPLASGRWRTRPTRQVPIRPISSAITGSDRNCEHGLFHVGDLRDGAGRDEQQRGQQRGEQQQQRCMAGCVSRSGSVGRSACCDSAAPSAGAAASGWPSCIRCGRRHSPALPPRRRCARRARLFQKPRRNRNVMIAIEMTTVGMTSIRPKSSILPSGTSSRPASASDADAGNHEARCRTPGRWPARSPSGRCRACRSLRRGLRASGAEMTSRTSRKIDCSSGGDGQRHRVGQPLRPEDAGAACSTRRRIAPSLAAGWRPSGRRTRSAGRPRP